MQTKPKQTIMELKSKQICRFCLTTNRPLINIYKTIKQNIPLSLQIIACVSIEVFPSDKMPATICELCSSIMQYIYEFKQMCKEADIALKLVPTTNIWPDALEIPHFPSEAPYKLSYDEDTQVLEIIQSDNLFAGDDSQTLSIVADPDGTEDIIEEVVEEEIAEQVQEEEPDTPTPKSPPKRPKKDKAPKVLNPLAAKRPRNANRSDERPLQMKRNKFGNVDIVIEEQPKVVPTNVFSCSSCERSFPLKQLLDIHERNHTRGREASCDVCPKKFFNKYDLAKHMVIHTGERPHICIVCNKSFSRSTLLHRHQKGHVGVPRFECSDCDRFYFTQDELDQHMVKHQMKRPFQCSACLKSFAFKQGLERHELTHAASQPFPCTYCKESFSSKNKLWRHLSGHAGKRPFPCKYCNKSYLMSHHLWRHLRSHAHTSKISVNFKCSHCQEEFTSTDDFKEHLKQHESSLEDHRCPLCNEQAANMSEHLAHMPLHWDGQQFACEFCDLIFVNEEALMNHSRSEHPEEHRIYDEDVARNVKESAAIAEGLKPTVNIEANKSEMSSVEKIINGLPRAVTVRRIKALVSSEEGSNIKIQTDLQQLRPKRRSVVKAKK